MKCNRKMNQIKLKNKVRASIKRIAKLTQHKNSNQSPKLQNKILNKKIDPKIVSGIEQIRLMSI